MSAAAVIAVTGAGTAVSHAEGAPAGALATDAAASVRADFDGDGYTDVAIAAPRRPAPAPSSTSTSVSTPWKRAMWTATAPPTWWSAVVRGTRTTEGRSRRPVCDC
ncbi:hypothetical protein ABZW44_14530 [Streptomyces mirabilis]|uniref:hypothetical protein n=1 Tax=Streptomyces mirabilis TaxID=68239 RepID=UPI0033A913CB